MHLSGADLVFPAGRCGFGFEGGHESGHGDCMNELDLRRDSKAQACDKDERFVVLPR